MARRLARYPVLALAALGVALGARSASALTINWTDWTAAQVGRAGTASGTITMEDGSVVTVTYAGEVAAAQTGGGTYWWTEGSPAPYTGNDVVDNAPATSDMIKLTSAGVTNTLTFSEAVDDLVMAFVSIGQLTLPVGYTFSTDDFTLLGEGRGWWGDGWWTQSGTTLTGYEAHGVIQFDAPLTTLSWVNTAGENWHGFTIGAPTPVPEPGALLLLGVGLLAVAGLRRRARGR